jgi:hypothetical protein
LRQSDLQARPRTWPRGQSQKRLALRYRFWRNANWVKVKIRPLQLSPARPRRTGDIALVGIRHRCTPRSKPEEPVAEPLEAFGTWASEKRGGVPPSGATSTPSGNSSPSPRKRARKAPKARAGRSEVRPASPKLKGAVRCARPDALAWRIGARRLPRPDRGRRRRG